jgi:Fur family ferric uptake transcriptional regulator
MELTPEKILANHQLRQTTCRHAVLDIFIEQNHVGLSENEIESSIKGDFDRVTIYRTLSTFLDSGIIHKVLDEGSVRYALCSSNCSEEAHQHEHVHFKCTECETTFCMDDIAPVEITLPKGYLKTEANYLIVGTCEGCNRISA